VAERVRVILSESALTLYVALALGLGTAAVLLVGARQVLAGQLTLGSLLLVIAYLGKLYQPLQTIGKQIAEQQGSLVGVRRAFALLDQAPAVVERKGARPLLRAEGRVTFRDVSFAYPGGPRVVHNVSFDVPSGARVGIAGPTGSGKTTLMNLLTRFYDVDEGAILIDGTSILDYRIADLRDQFAIVLQEPVLFSTTIAENIAYARADADLEAVIQAAKAANAHAFIAALPDGYNTLVGERGARLSGGERQRIALARAFLKDAPILILDEPTSSVDVETEGLIVSAMQDLMKGRTTFMIAHRLGTLEHCDVRLSMVAGRLTVGAALNSSATRTSSVSVTAG
jgi:ATP-binding cassette subfamily B protein